MQDAALAEQIKHNEFAKLPARQKALCKFAELLTHTPSAVRPQDLDRLRRHGLSDRDILDAVQVISYFNYINRVAEALGIDPEPEMSEAWRRWQHPGGSG